MNKLNIDINRITYLKITQLHCTIKIKFVKEEAVDSIINKLKK